MPGFWITLGRKRTTRKRPRYMTKTHFSTLNLVRSDIVQDFHHCAPSSNFYTVPQASHLTRLIHEGRNLRLASVA